MRLGLYGAAGQGPGGESWRVTVEAMGAVLVPIPIAAQEGGALACDAVLVTGAGEGDGGGARAAAEATNRPGWRAIDGFARAGGPVLALGAGVEVLCALGLLPGRVAARAGDAPGHPAASHLRVEGRPTPFTSAIPAGRVLCLAAAPAPRFDWLFPDAQALEASGQVIFRSCDAGGGPRRHGEIAGVSNPGGNVVGLFAVSDVVEGEGAQLLGSLRLHLLAGARRGRGGRTSP